MNNLIIGKISVDPPLILAPLAGITNLPFRLVCRKGGAGLVWTEMISSRALHFRDRRTKDMAFFHGDEHPVAAQIFGRDPEEMAEAARFLEGRGADIVDINMGCPVKKILKSGSGVQLMREPELAGKIVAKVVGAVQAPITVKFRLGWSGEETNFIQLGKTFEEEGAAGLVLHPRTRVQGFTGAVRWEAIEELADAVNIPVIGSGNVATGGEASRMLSLTGCAGVMVGRGALGKPWIFDTINAYIKGTGSDIHDKFRPELVQMHLELLLEYLPGRGSVGHLRKHLAWYSRGFAGGAAFRRTINEMTDPSDIVDYARDFLGLYEAAPI
jgi:tRNA-dihydrouridine synthase B